MKTRNFLLAVTVLMSAGMFLIIGCSSDKSGSHTNSLTDQVIDDFVETTYATAAVESTDVDYTALTDDTDQSIFGKDDIKINDMILKDNIVYSAVDEGVIMYNILDGKSSLISSAMPVNAIIDAGNNIIVGGDNLYTLKDGILSDEDYKLQLDGTITALYQDFPILYIGTTEGIYALDVTGIRKLAGNVRVSALTSDGLGLWVGTAGDGLYRWDGDSFHKRYLVRDSSLFDNVTALDFNHDHLYLGTDQGFFVYDGGSWTPFGVADGLPSETITAIDADEWVIKVGTSHGPVTFFENQFKPMSKLEGMVITRFIKSDKKLLAATSNAGLVMKSGGLVTTLFDRSTQPTQVALEEQW
jgi:ligand-binding sensor domain-containing protein